jgi:hypothetical protein
MWGYFIEVLADVVTVFCGATEYFDILFYLKPKKLKI